jgi:hypothetical protein
MSTQELELLSSHELHDRAVSHAVKHVDVGFLWSLVKAIPAAEAAAGNIGEADADVMSVARLLNDLIHSGEGEIADELRPLYLDYLKKHQH